MPADGPSANSGSLSSSSVSSVTASRVSKDSMSTCRCAPVSRATRSRRRSRACAPAMPRSGALERSSGVSAETFTDRLTRGSGPAPSCSSSGRCGQSARRRVQDAQRLLAAVGVGVGLLLGDRRLAEQVDRGRDAVAPQPLHRRQRVGCVGADDEALRHLLDARGRRVGDGALGERAAGQRGAAPGQRGVLGLGAAARPGGAPDRPGSVHAGRTSTKRKTAARSSASSTIAPMIRRSSGGTRGVARGRASPRRAHGRSR